PFFSTSSSFSLSAVREKKRLRGEGAMSHMVFQNVAAPKPCLPIPRSTATLPCNLRRVSFVR
ncbi:unnamed protein product, partial [Brassica napus]